MTDTSHTPPAETSADTEAEEALEMDAQTTIDKALKLLEAGEKELAQRLFERLRQRVLQAGPGAMLVVGDRQSEDQAELRSVVSAIAKVAATKPEADDTKD